MKLCLIHFQIALEASWIASFIRDADKQVDRFTPGNNEHDVENMTLKTRS